MLTSNWESLSNNAVFKSPRRQSESGILIRTNSSQKLTSSQRLTRTNSSMKLTRTNSSLSLKSSPRPSPLQTSAPFYEDHGSLPEFSPPLWHARLAPVTVNSLELTSRRSLILSTRSGSSSSLSLLVDEDTGLGPKRLSLPQVRDAQVYAENLRRLSTPSRIDLKSLIEPSIRDEVDAEVGRTSTTKSMSESLPILMQSQTLTFRTLHDNYSIETLEGESLATLDYKFNKDKKLLRDKQGEIIAVIFKHIEANGRHLFKICGPESLFPGQRLSNESKLFTWAEVKKSVGFSMKFSMKIRGGSGSITKGNRYVSEHFGPSLRNWSSARGYVVKIDGQNCADIAYLGDRRGLNLSPGTDPCLIICFMAVIDEMMEKRLQ